MKKPLIALLSTAILFSPLASQASAKEDLSISAKSGILLNPNTNEILFEKDADKQISPASLTKVMTLLVVTEEMKKQKTDPSTKVTISEKAWKSEGSLMFLNIGAEVPISDLIKGLAIVSGNDAAVALAEYFYGSTDAFVKQMNKRAKEIGMENTHFVTVNGLSEGKKGDLSTARDLMKLTDYYIEHFPENLKIHETKEFVTKAKYHGGTKDIVQQTRNPLLNSYEGGTGLKTGMVKDTYNLIGTAERSHTELIGVVLGAKSSKERQNSIFNLLDYGFSQYQKLNEGKKDEKIATLSVYKSKDTKKTDIYLKEDADFVINIKNKDKIKVKDKYPKHLEGGFKKGEKIGTRTITVGKDKFVFDIIVKEDISEASWYIKLLDLVAIKFTNLVEKL